MLVENWLDLPIDAIQVLDDNATCRVSHGNVDKKRKYRCRDIF